MGRKHNRAARNVEREGGREEGGGKKVQIEFYKQVVACPSNRRGTLRLYTRSPRRPADAYHSRVPSTLSAPLLSITRALRLPYPPTLLASSSPPALLTPSCVL